jgi:hypothetical protein
MMLQPVTRLCRRDAQERWNKEQGIAGGAAAASAAGVMADE